ncbi:hypothetical protein B0H14DRAFT_2365725 [Mycena olivaceomarginata]|nr:hypothetical protein B0H14DRAFT_2365725 [Mycena olivaceomarginata]
MWEKAYEVRREAWKKTASSEKPKLVPPVNDDRQSPSVNDGSAFRNAFTLANDVPEIRQDVAPSELLHNVDIEAHVQKWTLNREQARAFKIIAHHGKKTGRS